MEPPQCKVQELKSCFNNNEDVDLDTVVENWIKHSKNIPLNDVPYHILQTVASYFPPSGNWKKLAKTLGVEHLHELKIIEGDSMVKQIWPSEILLLHCARNYEHMFSALLTALHKELRRLDCLQELHDQNYVTDFLEKYECKKASPFLQKGLQDDLVALIGQEAFLKRMNYLVANKLLPFGNMQLEQGLTNDVWATLISQNPFGSPNISKKFDLNLKAAETETVQSHQKKFDAAEIGNIEVVKNAISNKVVNVKKPLKKRMVILLTYSPDANDVVPDLVNRFWEVGIGVVAEYVLKGKGYFETNYIAAWQKFFNESRFVVPIITTQYLKDVANPSTENEQSRDVRLIYDLYTRKYVKDGCLNHIVRPLMASSSKIRVLNPTLEVTWKMPEELDDFFDMMKKYADAT